MLWVRGDTCTPAFPLMTTRQNGAERAIMRALKATNLILQAGGFGVVGLDLADAPAAALRRVPMTTWLRLQRVLEGQEAVGLMLAPMPLSRSAGGVSVTLSPLSGTGDWSPLPSATAHQGRLGAGRSIAGPQVFRGLESEVRTARSRLVPGANGAPVRLRASA